jgi:hypothetical protein
VLKSCRKEKHNGKHKSINHAKNYSTQRRFFMIKTDPTMLVCDATPGPWQYVAGATNGGGRLIIESHDFGAIAATSKRGAPSTQSRLSPDSPYYRSSELAVMESNARLICAAPPLLKVAQKLLLWMEDRMAACDFNRDDIDLYHELRQTIRSAGGFSSERNEENDNSNHNLHWFGRRPAAVGDMDTTEMETVK